MIAAYTKNYLEESEKVVPENHKTVGNQLTIADIHDRL